MPSLIAGLTTYVLTVVATFATLFYVPSTAPFRTLLLVIFFMALLIGYPTAGLFWVAAHIKVVTSWQILTTCKKKGIIRIYEDGREGIIRSAPHIATSRTIRIIQTSGIGIIRGEKQAIVSALEHPNAKVKVLLANPHSDFIEEVEEVEGKDRKNVIGNEVVAGEALLKEYIREAQILFGAEGSIGKIYFGHYNTHFRLSLLLCDNTWGWMTLIIPPKRAVETVSIELEQSRFSLLNDCIKHFDAIWEKCENHEIKP